MSDDGAGDFLVRLAAKLAGVGILQLRRNELDVEYIERWVTELRLGDLWRRVQADS
jgi:hypothetical protein